MHGGIVVELPRRVVYRVLRGEQAHAGRRAMTQRPVQPEPFLRGAPYPSFGDVPYPRANPSDTSRLPADIWHAATVPAGVRLEVVGDAEAIDIAYRTTTGNLGYRGDGAGISFSVWRGGRRVGEEECVLGDSLEKHTLLQSRRHSYAVFCLEQRVLF